MQRHAVSMEGERGGTAGDADVRGRERDDACELERGYDEQRRRQRPRDPESGRRERGCSDARADRAGDPGEETREAARSGAAQRCEQGGGAPRAAAGQQPRGDKWQGRCSCGGERNRRHVQARCGGAADRQRYHRQPAGGADRRGDAARGEQAAGRDAAEEPEPNGVPRAGGHERVHERPGPVAGAGVAERERAADQRPPARRGAGDGGGEAAAGEHELPGIRSAQRGEHRPNLRQRRPGLRALRPDRHRAAPPL